MLAMFTPLKGEHHDLFQIQVLFDEICVMLKKANIFLDGHFLNADPGMDSEGFRQACEKENSIPNIKLNPRNEFQTGSQPYEKGKNLFDEELYKDRSVIEHANAWIDGFKALLVRFEFSVIFLSKIIKK